MPILTKKRRTVYERRLKGKDSRLSVRKDENRDPEKHDFNQKVVSVVKAKKHVGALRSRQPKYRSNTSSSKKPCQVKRENYKLKFMSSYRAPHTDFASNMVDRRPEHVVRDILANAKINRRNFDIDASMKTNMKDNLITTVKCFISLHEHHLQSIIDKSSETDLCTTNDEVQQADGEQGLLSISNSNQLRSEASEHELTFDRQLSVVRSGTCVPRLFECEAHQISPCSLQLGQQSDNIQTGPKRVKGQKKRVQFADDVVLMRFEQEQSPVTKTFASEATLSRSANDVMIFNCREDDDLRWKLSEVDDLENIDPDDIQLSDPPFPLSQKCILFTHALECFIISQNCKNKVSIIQHL